MFSRRRWSNNAAGQNAITAVGGIAFICLCVCKANALPCSPTAAGKEVALEIGFKCYLTARGSAQASGLAGTRQVSTPPRERLSEALAAAGGKKIEAARIPGVSRVTLWKWLKNHNIQM